MRIIMLLVLFLVSCKPIQYKPDIGFISDGQANVPSHIVEINGKSCKGGCYVTAKKNTTIHLKLPTINFSYRIDIQSSSNYGYAAIFDIKGEEGMSIELPSSNVDVFNIIGRIYKQDSLPDSSIFFEARIRLYDEKFVPRVEAYKSNGWLIFGEDALNVNCEDKLYIKATGVKNCNKGFSITEGLRINSYGYDE